MKSYFNLTKMKKVLWILLAVIILMQIIRPDKNIDDKVSPEALNQIMEVPADIETILERSCYDCHSNNTHYDWYHEIAPISWLVNSHVKEGKEHLNFDAWSSYNERQKNHIISDLDESVREREMPLALYVVVHPEARISEEDNQKLLDWINTLSIK